MKRAVIFFLSALFVLSCYYAFSQYEDFTRAGGYEWNSYSDPSKLGFTLGFICGVHKALEELDIFIRQSSYNEKKAEELLPIYNVTNTQLKGGLNNFYKDPANISIPIKDAGIIVLKEIKEKDAERIEKEKKLLRLPPQEQRLVKRVDYLKQEIKRGEHPRYELKEEKILEKESGKPVPLETEEEIVDFWTEQILPEEAPKVKEVVKVDYTLAIVISLFFIVIIGFILFKFKIKRRKEK